MLARLLLLLVTTACVALGARAQDISDAEKMLFMSDHLKGFKKPAVLSYRYKKTSANENAYEDRAVVRIKSVSDQGKVVKVEYLSKERGIDLPETNATTGNPILLSFLEKDVREMNRLTRGSVYHFRKQVRLGLAQEARVRPVEIEFEGKKVAATEISMTPFVNDPYRARFRKYEKKLYVFTLCDEVPGNVYQMRTVLNDERNNNATLEEIVLTFDGVK